MAYRCAHVVLSHAGGGDRAHVGGYAVRLASIVVRQARIIREQRRDIARLTLSYRTAVDANHSQQRALDSWRLRAELLYEITDQDYADEVLSTQAMLEGLPVRDEP